MMKLSREETLPKSGEIARRRLKSVIDSEKNGVSARDMDLIRRDLEQVIKSYFEADGDFSSLSVERVETGEAFTRRVVFTATVSGVKRTGVTP